MKNRGDIDLSLFASLPDRDLRREGLIVGEGRLVASRVAARCRLLGVLAEPSAAAEAEALAAGRCPVAALPAAEIASVAGYAFHRGLLVVAERPVLPSAEELLGAPFSRLVVLPRPTDPENLGAVVRSAAALGWDGVLLGPECCDPFGRRALRCSMGAVLSVPLFLASGPGTLAALAEAGWTALAADLADGAVAAGSEAARTLLSPERRVALVLGNERDGIPPDWRRACTAAVAVPQARNSGDGVDSLNVAAAAAILLWEGIRS